MVGQWRGVGSSCARKRMRGIWRGVEGRKRIPRWSEERGLTSPKAVSKLRPPHWQLAIGVGGRTGEPRLESTSATLIRLHPTPAARASLGMAHTFLWLSGSMWWRQRHGYPRPHLPLEGIGRKVCRLIASTSE